MSRVFKSLPVERDNRAVVESLQFFQFQEAEAGGGADEAPPVEEDPAVVAQAILDAARAEAEALKEAARRQVDMWEEKARRAGWEKGYQEARGQVEEELGEALKSALALADSALLAQHRFLREEQARVGELAVAIAAKIIGRELLCQPETVADIVLHAVEAAEVKEDCRVRVNPLDYDLLFPRWQAATAARWSQYQWDLVPDKRQPRGGCLIEANGGSIDAAVEVQLREIAAAFDEIADRAIQDAP